MCIHVVGMECISMYTCVVCIHVVPVVNVCVHVVCTVRGCVCDMYVVC